MLRKLNCYVIKVGIFLVTIALIAGMVGCDGDSYTPPSKDLEIRTWYDLDDVRDNLDGDHILMNDLDSTTPGYDELASPTANGGKGWQAIEASCIPPGCGFRGTFDGQGHEICDLFINCPGVDSVGLFGYVGEGGVIEDIGVVNATVVGGVGVGCLAGGNHGIVSDSYCSANVTGNTSVGGLVGFGNGIVRNCCSTGNVTGNWGVGGLAGSSAYGGSVTDCYSTGNVTGISAVGGLVGDNCRGTVRKSYSTGSVSGDEDVGGLVGYNPYGTVSNSFWDIETSGQSYSWGGTGKNTTEMQDITTFSGAGWDITTVANPDTRNPAYIWNIVDDVTYPFLSWQP